MAKHILTFNELQEAVDFLERQVASLREHLRNAEGCAASSGQLHQDAMRENKALREENDSLSTRCETLQYVVDNRVRR